MEIRYLLTKVYGGLVARVTTNGECGSRQVPRERERVVELSGKSFYPVYGIVFSRENKQHNKREERRDFS